MESEPAERTALGRIGGFLASHSAGTASPSDLESGFPGARSCPSRVERSDQEIDPEMAAADSIRSGETNEGSLCGTPEHTPSAALYTAVDIGAHHGTICHPYGSKVRTNRPCRGL